MLRRLPLITVLLLGGWLVAVGQPPKAESPADAAKSANDLRKPQEQNAKLFRELSQGLLRLAQKLERSDKPEDQERSRTIRAALKVAEEAGVENQFQKLVGGLGKGAAGLQDFAQLRGQDAELSKALQEIVNILMTDDESAKLKQEIARLTEILKEVKDIKRRQEIVRAMTEAQKGDASKIAKTQGDLAKQTKDLAERVGGKSGDGKDKPKPDPKAEIKPEGKPGDKAAEPKDPDTKPGTPAAGEGEPKAGSEAKPSDPNAQRSEAKPGPEAKPSEAKPGKAKTPPEPKPSEAKPGDPKAGSPEPKPAEPLPKGDAKPAGPQQSSARGTGESKDKQGNSKSGGQPTPPAPGAPGESGGEAQAKKQDPPGRKQIQEAYPHQQGAEEDLKKEDRPNASKKESKAIEELAKAIEELEKRLKQLREEEMEKLLANIEARCNRMLAMQIEVYETTRSIHVSVLKSNNVKSNADVQKAQTAATRENEIIVEADKAMKLMESEGSAVAFAKVLEEVRGDMAMIQRRLEAAYVDTDTQSIEENVIAMLKDMVAALKKAQQDMKDKDKKDGGGGGKQNQQLIDKLAELRLIRALQVHVNQRTTMHGKKAGAEQASDPIIQNELRQLSTRQAKLQDMIHKIATQANQ